MLPIIASVEPEREFVQVALEMLPGDPAMVGAPEPSFKVSDNLVDPGQDLACPLGLPLHLGAMVVLEGVQAPVGWKGIGVDLAVCSYAAPNEPSQSVVGQIGQDLHTNPSCMVPSVFHSYPYGNLRFNASTDDPSASSSMLRPTNIGIVHFHDTLKRFPHGIDHGPAQPPAQRECRPVRSDPKLVLELQGRYPWSQGAHQVCCPEPVADGQVAVLENGPCRQLHISAASPTSPPAQPHPPADPTPTPWASEPLRPAYQRQIAQAGLLRGEPALKFAESSRKLGVTLGGEFSTHA